MQREASGEYSAGGKKQGCEQIKSDLPFFLKLWLLRVGKMSKGEIKDQKPILTVKVIGREGGYLRCMA